MVITIPYCFSNTEVRTALSNTLYRWKLSRGLGSDNASRGTRSTRNSISMAGYYSTNVG